MEGSFLDDNYHRFNTNDGISVLVESLVRGLLNSNRMDIQTLHRREGLTAQREAAQDMEWGLSIAAHTDQVSY